MSGIYHRCHKREFLLKFPRDRRRWIEWLYQAKKRYSGLSVLNYNEIQSPRKRKGIIDFDRLLGLLGFGNYDDLKDAHCKWVNSAMQTENRGKENKWTQSIAVGSKTFIEKMKETLGFKAKGRKINYADDTFELREVLTPYGKANSQESGNTFLWDQ
jgi:putative transposase